MGFCGNYIHTSHVRLPVRFAYLASWHEKASAIWTPFADLMSRDR